MISFAGVILNLILFLIFLFLFKIFNLGVFNFFAVCNLSLAIFNILPVRMLDGGNIIYLVLLNRFASKTAEKILDVVSCIFLVILTLLCYAISKNFKINFSLFIITIYLILNLFFKNIF